MLYEKRENFHKIIVTPYKKIQDVASLKVCHMICLDSELEDWINAWEYSKTELHCTCFWIEAPVCKIDFDLTPVKSVSEIEFEAPSWLNVSSLIYMDKVVPCGKIIIRHLQGVPRSL